MKPHIVLYRLASDAAPLAYTCEASDLDHAEIKCENDTGTSDIVWCQEGSSIEEAMEAFEGAQTDDMPTIYIEVRNGTVYSVYGDRVDCRVVVRDLDSIEEGSSVDELPHGYTPSRFYW